MAKDIEGHVLNDEEKELGAMDVPGTTGSNEKPSATTVDAAKTTTTTAAAAAIDGPMTSSEALKGIKGINEKLLKHSHNADEAMKAFEGLQGQVVEISEEKNRALLRKIDMHILPIMCIVYGLNYLDKTTLSYASIMGIKLPHSHNKLKSGIHLVGDQYSWLASTFYWGYLAFEYFTNRLLQVLPLGKYSAFNIIMWGMVLSCFAAVENYAGAIAIRFFLGLLEASVTPAFALLTSQWYTKKEQGWRTAIWPFCCNGVAQVVGGVVAYAIAVGSRKHGTAVEPWKIVFLVTGLLTTTMGFIFLWIVPDNQLNCRWLSKEDRILAIERIRVNAQGVGNKKWKLYQFKEALIDPLSWAFFWYALLADIPNGGISNYFSQLIQGFGFTAEQSLLYGTPGGAVEVIALLVCGFAGDYFGYRVLISMSGLCVAILGMILIVALPLHNNAGRLVGYYLTQASPTPFVALLSLLSSNVAGYTKKTTVAAMYLIGYCAGNIIGPQTFQAKDAPRYVPAEITIIVCWALCLVDLLFIHMYCKLQNKKKEQVRADPGYIKLNNVEFMDLTDRENPEFVYTL